jgi:hypothetical protein
MENLKDQRQELKEKEMQQLSLQNKILEQERERFDYADTSQWILDQKFDTDLIFMQDKILEWLKSAKNEYQKKVLNEMLLVSYRIYTYTEQMRTLTKATVSKFMTFEKTNYELNSTNRILKLELTQLDNKKNKKIDALKKEIEFLSK